MNTTDLTFNDLPKVVGELCERIAGMENLLRDTLNRQSEPKENLHVPMTVQEACAYLKMPVSTFYYKIKKDFKAKKLEEYGQIFFNVHGADSLAFVELLDGQDKVLRTVPVVDGKADFYFLNPGKYGARLINDTNGNGVWDTGNYAEKRQPEMVYYYPMVLELKANFDLTQEWDIKAKSLDRQKPDELKKQKPDEDKKKQNRNKNNRSGNSSRNSGRGHSY